MYRFYIIILITLISSSLLYGQRQPRQGQQRGATVYGQIVNSQDEQSIEYAYVILYRAADSSQIAGTISDEEGMFALMGISADKYYLDVNYMGYEPVRIEDISIEPESRRQELGTIYLKPSIIESDEIEVVAEKAAVEYKIDKKVINVEGQQTAASGNAVDVLENVPSITVDVERNVQLRGSPNFMVLIDNKPSVLDANDALQQIPASTIENIEIITNPSAKYDPDGTSGIINIVTRKNQLLGVSGLANLDVGVNDKYGGDFLIGYRGSGFNAYFGADYNDRKYPGMSQVEHVSSFEDTISYINSSGNNERKGHRFGVRGGIDIDLTSMSSLGIGLRYGDRARARLSALDYDEWANPGNGHNYYVSTNESERSRNYYSVELDYRHQFGKKGHQLLGQMQFSQRDGDEFSINELISTEGDVTSGQKNTEKGPSGRLRMKLDYTLPFNENGRFEAGYQNRISNSEDITETYNYQPATGEYEFIQAFSYETLYERNIHSIYSLYADEVDFFGFQGGLRTEYTYRSIEQADSNIASNIDRWDFFPTIHMSFNVAAGQQAMLSYTRRIDRPRGYYLEPFLTWTDAYNVRQGNPDIQPEYIDSYEAGYQTYFGKNLISLEAYYRKTNNKIERIRSVYGPNVTLHTVDNVGFDYALGSELMINADARDWWNLNLMGNLYQYKVEGDLEGRDFSRESFNWGARLNNTFKLTRFTTIQVNGSYTSPSVSAQGERSENYYINASIRQELMDRSLSMTLQMRDILRTSRYESITEGAAFRTYRYSEREAPVIMLNIRYNFNNYKQKRDKNDRNGDMEDEEF